MTAISAHAVLQEKRGSRRWDVQVPLQVRGLGTGPADATVSDLSRFGCGVRCQRPYHPGAEVKVILPGLAPLDAVVIWCRERDMGLKFDSPLHAAVADHLIRTYPAPSSED